MQGWKTFGTQRFAEIAFSQHQNAKNAFKRKSFHIPQNTLIQPTKTNANKFWNCVMAKNQVKTCLQSKKPNKNNDYKNSTKLEVSPWYLHLKQLFQHIYTRINTKLFAEMHLTWQVDPRNMFCKVIKRLEHKDLQKSRFHSTKTRKMRSKQYLFIFHKIRWFNQHKLSQTTQQSVFCPINTSKRVYKAYNTKKQRLQKFT